METLKDPAEDLRPELWQEVKDFVEFLLSKWKTKPRGKPSVEWAGALKDLRNRYTSIELQHKISEWRIGEK